MNKKEIVIAIVGRPNVGKSSLVNKIIGHRSAIVHNLPGVTRDRNYYQTEWMNRALTLIDTGGIYNDNAANRSIEFQKDIEAQVRTAIAEADIIVLLVDGKTGLHPLDKEVALLLQKAHQQIFLAVNKMETSKRDLNSYEFYNLGFESIHPLSAITGQGVAELLDDIIGLFPDSALAPEKSEETVIRVAIVGKPNAGKSSLLNTLLGRERSIVSPIPGTTRDAIDEEILREKTRFRFIDTAGIRKKARVTEDIEYYSVNRAIQAIENCDIAILMLDAQKLVEEQDQKIAGLIEQNRKGCLIAVNKWDLVVKDSTTINSYEKLVRGKLKFLSYCPVLFISAKNAVRTYDLYQILINIYQCYTFRASTAAVNKAVKQMTESLPPRVHKGKQLKIYYATQAGTKPPAFTFFTNNANLVHFAYERYLENRLREHFNLYGTPLALYFRSKKQKA